METNERKAFMFLRSYYEAACAINDKNERADFYHAIFTYFFNGEEVTMQGTPLAMFTLAKPNIDASIKKAEAGAKGGKSGNKNESNDKQNGNKEEANRKQTESKSEANDKQEGSKPQAIKDKGYKDKGNNISPYNPPKGAKVYDEEFEVFWKEYPRGDKKSEASKAFAKARQKTTQEILLAALRKFKESYDWQKDGGTYIPYASTWLNQERWLDKAEEEEPELPFADPEDVAPKTRFYAGYELEE